MQPGQGRKPHPIGDLATRFELIAPGHSHIGEVAALGCLCEARRSMPSVALQRAWTADLTRILMTAKALEDVTILDFSHLLQGPFATQLLADMGANVIKVEPPGRGDLFRTLTFNNRWVGGSESPNFLAWNRNKRSLAVDLKAPAAKTIVYRIAGSVREPARLEDHQKQGVALPASHFRHV